MEEATIYVAPSQARRRVLIVEDDPVTVRILSRPVSRLGGIVHTARTAKEALELILQNTYDLIIIDAHLPDLHGSEVVRAVRGNMRIAYTPILAISSDDGSDNIKLLKSVGVNEFVAKPITAEMLGELLPRWL